MMIQPKFFKFAPLFAYCFLGAALYGQNPVAMNTSPSRVIGHPKLAVSTGNPNLVEGREFYNPQSVAVDAARDIIYVADASNNRVLGWRNASSFDNRSIADFVLGQQDRFSTASNGPGTAITTGFTGPVAVTVDPQGNLWVVDAGNNRILRFPTPFTQTGSFIPNLVIGQPNFNSRLANQGAGPTAQTLSLSSGSSFFRSGIVFDPDGSLWVSDAGNNRVLRYPASAVQGNNNNPSANIVLGQANFTSNVALPTNAATSKTGFRTPSGIAVESATGRLYVVDSLSRVVVFDGGFFDGRPATRIMGRGTGIAGPALPLINELSLGVSGVPPEGVFVIGNIPFVVDTPAHRIVRYEPFDQWQPEVQSFSPPAVAVIGQDELRQTAAKPNRGQLEPLNNSMTSPIGAFFANGEVFVVDSGNHRVLAFPDLSTGPATATGAPYGAKRVLGQLAFEFRAPNLIEGREFQFLGGLSGAGIAIDYKSNPPRLYVADPNNHRVLGFADARKVRPGDKADVVIGQVDLNRALINSPLDQPDTRGDEGLYFPFGVAVDPQSNLWVADSGNSRVLRFPSPFQQVTQSRFKADVVLGQANFNTRITDATELTMSFPYGLALTVEGNLAVSDPALNRVLVFRAPFTSGMAALRVIGQQTFTLSATGSGTLGLNNPRHISIDTDGRLYVADTVNNRVQIFGNVNGTSNGPAAVLTLTTALNGPLGVVVSPLTGEIWVANTNANTVLRYPRFDVLINNTASTQTIPSQRPLALALDPFGNLFVADSFNRVGLYYPTVAGINAASGFQRFTPGMYTGLYAGNYTFTDKTRSFNELPNPLPIPTLIEDIQVFVNDIPSPITLVSPGQINFILPYGLPTSGVAELQVVQASSGRVIASTQLQMDVASPGLFTANFSGQGQLLALNQNNSLNGPTNRIRRNEVIQLFGTGAGKLNNAPADGAVAVGLITTDPSPAIRVFINGREAVVNYSGLTPGQVSLWQVNAVIPDTTAPGDAVVNVILNDIANNNGIPAFRVTIAVQ
jgi:uncharacterized protein (TIGR03437 family)